MSDSPKVLVVLTSHDKLGDTGKPTGWYLSELAHPYDILTAQGFSITLASPAGGPAPLDPSSVEAASDDAVSQGFLTERNALWEATEPLVSFLGRADEFAALFFPGGHGPMFDLAVDPTSQALVQEFAAKGKVVAAVCHGPAALVGVEGLLEGKAVTGFTNAEEEAVGLDAAMPFALEDRLVEVVGKGGRFEKAAEKWGEKVVVDGKLITGQNPASAKGVGEAIVRAVLGRE
ncbi:class I glutamine amidotransferase-like protein [Chaetomium fimeti]|uniref:D-lactate dehydratase n=1 Tax=Chaetomium fimeti TaxID=1854472 RepID=A0AAE0HDG4_9PEZI|nr:class I glutamine amidotransferase-like protein [Chaetomium fimeti]